MKPVLAILRRFLIGLVRNRANLGFMVVLPVVFTLIFGVVPAQTTNRVLVDVVDHDGSQVSHAIIQQINSLPGFSTHTVSTDQAQSDLRNLQASVVITLPQGVEKSAITGKPVAVNWQPSPNAGSASTVSDLMKLQSQLNRWMIAGNIAVQKHSGEGTAIGTNGRDGSSSDMAATFIKGMQQSSGIHNLIATNVIYLSQGKVQHQTLTTGQSMIIGFATMFIILSVFGSTGSLYQEKQKGTWARFKASPAAKAQILTGYGLGFFVVGWIQFLIMDIAGMIFFGHGLSISLWTAIIVSLYVFAVVGIALCIAGVVTSSEQHMMIGSFIAIATSMLGGAYWPLNLEPSWMQKVAYFVPQSWAIEAFKATAIGVVSLGSVAIPLAVLGAFAVIFFSAGILQLRYS